MSDFPWLPEEQRNLYIDGASYNGAAVSGAASIFAKKSRVTNSEPLADSKLTSTAGGGPEALP